MYLIIGANGFLGNYVIRSILNITKENIVALDVNIEDVFCDERITWKMCNILDESAFESIVSEYEKQNDVKVIFLAAFHHPDKVAENPEFAWNMNVTALSRCINKLRFAKRLFYASTDSVYGNSVEHYHFREGDTLNPVNIYGKNKAAAEAVVFFSGFNVVRYPFLIAPSLVKGKKHFYDNIVDSLKNGVKIEMFSDSYRSSLNFKTAADLMIKLCEKESRVPGILNICGDNDLSKYDIGLMIADKFGVSRDLVVPIQMQGDSTIFSSARAVSTLMDNTMVKKILRLERIEFEL